MQNKQKIGLWALAGITIISGLISLSFAGMIYLSTLPDDIYQSIHSTDWEKLNVNRMEFSRAEDFDHAEAELKERIASDPESPIPHFLLGTLYETKGKYDTAESEFNKSIKLSENSQWNQRLYQHFQEDSHAELALINYYKGNNKKALKELEKVSHSSYGRSPELLNALRTSLEEPQRGDFHLALAIELRKILQLKHARLEFKAAKQLAFDPALKAKADQYLQVKLPHETAKISPIARYYTLAGALQETVYQNPEKAADYYIKAISEAPSFDWAYSQLGVVSHQSQNYAQALSSARKATELNPKSISPHLTMGDVEIDAENYGKAIIHYQKALSIGREFLLQNDAELLANIENQLGFAYEQLGKNLDAKRHYQLAYKTANESSNDYQYAEEALERVQ